MEISNLIQTGELAKDEVADKLVKEAEAHAEEQIETIKEQKSKRKKALIKFGSMAVLAAVVVVFATIAWFTMNRETTTSGMNVRSSTLPFELASTGAAPEEYIRLFNMADNEYDNGTKQGDTSEYRTGEYGQIFWRLDTESNDTYVNGFKPGAAGVFTFDIIPKDGRALTVNCKFNIRGFVGNYNDAGNLQSMTEITSSSPENASKEAFNYINGHIVFFEHHHVINGKDVYSGFIGTDGLNVSISAGTSRETVTVYWKWVNTFDQMILKSTDHGNDIPLVADEGKGVDEDRTALCEYINDNYSKIFAGLSSENQTAASTLTYQTAKTNSELMNALNDGYNSADQIIGVNLNYFLLELSASPAS